MREPSVFELIVEGKIPSVKIREDDEFLAILDLFPNCKGQTLVITKQRYDSDISLMPEDVYSRYMIAVKGIIALLKKSFNVEKVGIIVEGEGVPHAHVKLYPMHDGDRSIEKKEPVWFNNYPGYLTSKSGKQKSKEELEAVAKEIKYK